MMISLFVRLTVAVAIALLALFLLAFILKVFVVAAVVAALIVGGMLLVRRLRRRGSSISSLRPSRR
jgi:hypothetical protein